MTKSIKINRKMNKIELHWKILIGLISGLIFGIFSSLYGLSDFTSNWVSPFGLIFINLLKLIAVPLVLTSLVCGVASLSDTKKLSRIGGKTILIYLTTTTIAVSVGLIVSNSINPGNQIPQEMKLKLQETYKETVDSKKSSANEVKVKGPLQPIIDIVPNNFFKSASNNRNMLQIVFISILIGIGLIQISDEKSEPILRIFQGFNDIIIKIVNMIMLIAPIGVFSLIAETINKVAGNDYQQILELLSALGLYMLTVILGLLIFSTITYGSMIKLFSPIPVTFFLKKIFPAQLLAFSTSSSGATLPLTMEVCEKELGVSDEVSSFVLPLGATINMDGTALYQAVAAMFISQALGWELTLGNQLTIVLTAVLASIGSAAVPGAGIIMLVIVLESVGIPSAGIALIVGVDRLLDMIRTTINVSGDATVSVVIANSENQLKL